MILTRVCRPLVVSRRISRCFADKPTRRRVKPVSQLPVSYLTSEGRPAAPLPEWQSDSTLLQTSESKARRQRRKRPVDDQSPEAGPSTSLPREIQANLAQFPHCLLLTRVGQFYESYFDQAAEIASLLNIKLTSRKWTGTQVAMCGFPIAQLDRYLKILVQREKRFVAMCEEFPQNNDGSKTFQRRVTRIVTPGTLIDESFLNPLSNNFLLALAPSDHVVSSSRSVGLAWIDVSTGECFSENCSFESLQDEIARISPSEIVLPHTFRDSQTPSIIASLASPQCLISFTSATSPSEPPILHSIHPQEVEANAILVTYLKENLREHMPRLTSPLQEDTRKRMQIDVHTINGLEIRESGYEGGTRGSLLSTIKHTVTCGGSRLLSRWLCSPSTDINEIRSRHTIVSFFHQRPFLRSDLIAVLKQLEDIGRTCQKFGLRRADISDLLTVHNTIDTWKRLSSLIDEERRAEPSSSTTAAQWENISSLLSKMEDLDALSLSIGKAVIFAHSDMQSEDSENEQPDSDDLPVHLLPEYSQKWTINPEYSPALQKLHQYLQQLHREKLDLENKLQLDLDAPSLTLRLSPGQGYYVHLSKSKRDRRLLDEHQSFHSIGESASTKSYFFHEWFQLGTKIAETSIKLSQAEREVFEQLRLQVVHNSDILRQNAQIIDELDVLLSFATLADELGFVQPVTLEDETYTVTNGRHPTVEMGLLTSGRTFVSNSLQLTHNSHLHIITGPNMGGKSTFLRQTALIAILAQVGCFVPAKQASIGIVDRVFSRIGAKDDLFRDRSTFMVEMLETAEILRRATPKSLVIMDEIGRGTTMRDGLAIAYATLWHLATINKSRCLFATHFHELAEMVGMDPQNLAGQGEFGNVRFYCTDVGEGESGYASYGYRLHPGINRDSHGLKVAQIAGMPSSAMEVAHATLIRLKEQPRTSILHL